MWFTKNEKSVLKLLLRDAKLSDTDIAKEINISSQAVGRIRARLEEDVIQGYTLKLNSKILGLDVISIIKITCNNTESISIEEIENEIEKLPEVMFFLKTIGGNKEHILVAGFKNLGELEKFINENKKVKCFNDSCSIKEIISIPSNCVLKNSNQEIYKLLIDSCGVKHAERDAP